MDTRFTKCRSLVGPGSVLAKIGKVTRAKDFSAEMARDGCQGRATFDRFLDSTLLESLPYAAEKTIYFWSVRQFRSLGKNSHRDHRRWGEEGKGGEKDGEGRGWRGRGNMGRG